MPNFNNVVIVGRLTADPKLRYVASGVPVCEFSIAYSKKFTKEDGQAVEETSFFDIEVWRRQGELCAQFLSKGKHALIMGELKQERWQDKVTHQNRSKLKIVATTVQFMDRAQKADDAPSEAEVEPDPLDPQQA